MAHDVGQETAARIGVQQWAKCSERNSERDVQKIVKKQRTQLDIPIHNISCDGTDLPWVSPESWLQFIVRNGMWPVMAGCCLHDYEGARRKWEQFWTTYKEIHPGFGLFDDDNVDLSRCAAFFIHGDEGRTLKKGGMMVTSLQSALGRGYDEKRVRRPGEGGRHDLQVNFAGHSFTTRFILSAIPKTAYDVQPNLFHDAIGHVAKSCRRLLDYGYVDATRGGETFRICILGVKGDAPYLSKVGRFYRSYNTTAKRGEERGPPKGVCPYCLAGTNLCAAEELATTTPRWLSTMAVKLPWLREPSLITHLAHDRFDPASFFKSDIWHVFHLGFGRSWIASLVQLVLPQLPLPNLDEKWDYLSDHCHRWCSRNRKQSHIGKISPYLMSYNDTGGCMGNWHKGALTTNFMLWMVSLLGDVPVDSDGLLAKARATTYRVNEMFSVLYRSGAFLSENEGRFVAEQGLKFLEVYYEFATIMFARGKQWCFPLYPKLHIWHHLQLGILRSIQECRVACNPNLWGCQMDEDTVGRASRLSRRVNVRRVSLRSLQRYLICAYSAMVKCGMLK